MVVNPVPNGPNHTSNGNGGGQLTGICGDCLEDLMPSLREVNVHAQGIYIFQTPGTYDVVLRHQQLAPNAIWPPQQVQIVPLGNQFGSNGQAAGVQPAPSNFSGSVGQAPYGAPGTGQSAAGGGYGMNNVAQPMLPITATDQRAHPPSPFSMASSFNTTSLFGGPPDLSALDSAYSDDNVSENSLNPYSP